MSFSVESLPTSSQTRAMNQEEDDIFSDSLSYQDDEKDPDFRVPEMSEQSSEENSQFQQVIMISKFD